MRLALYQPDMPQNVGAAIRVAACFGAAIDIIGPCGFSGGERDIRRVAMDYALAAPPVFHDGWRTFLSGLRGASLAAAPSGKNKARLALMTTKGATDLWKFTFMPDDVILLGRESAGVPLEVHEAADARLRIPLAPLARSLNVAVAGAVALAEARRQTGWPTEVAC